MVLEFDENTINNLKPGDVAEWYAEHHTEQDLADIYEIVHEIWVYYEDCTYDYEEDTPEYEKTVAVFEEWSKLFLKLEGEILSILRSHNINIETLDIKALDIFMAWHGYENHGGWYIKDEPVDEDSAEPEPVLDGDE